MKRLVVMMCVVGLSFVLHAQNLTISGGSEHSVMICGKGLVYAWGNNKDATKGYNNLLGLKDAAQASAAFVTKPTEVQLPVGVTFKQVDAGSGAFNIALACNNVVYMWGANESKQLGQGNASTVTHLSVPTPVVKGATSGSTATGMSAYLGNVTYVSASTTSAYAIMSDKRVVAWGSNSYKQLGNPAVTATTWGEPTYMKMKATATSPVVDITNVIFLDAGDEQVLALVDDGVIGDGVGTVYSCGGSAYNAADLVLGRPATNTDVFMPVLKQDGTPLSNIKMVSAGDSHGIAVDATTGYVWSWGNDGWGCLTGTTFPNPSTQGNRASRVVSGEYKTISGLDYLTNVKQVGGGRGFAVAVTNDGYVLSWGNNAVDAGYLGSGTAAGNSCTTGPQFVRYSTAGNPIVNDGVSVSDGDTWGFFINKNNQYYAWGQNNRGQLGDNSVTTRNYAVPITSNIPCDIPNPCPKADMPPYYNVCPGQPFGLYAGFAPPTGKNAMYQFKWFFGTSMTGPWTPITGTTHTITVSDIGWYKVEINYLGTDIPCDACQTSVDVVELRAIEANFYDPIEDGDTLFYCGNYADVNIYQKIASPTDEYKWYPTLTSTTELGSSIGTATTTLNKTGFTDVIAADSIYRVWVEDVSSFLVTAARETGSFSGAFVNKESYGVDKDGSKITFTLTSTVTLKKVKFRQQAWGASV
ncbi:MAG TPA: hypothetical protein PK029_01545, partial [Bacteroidales bacterium]|nr:hypothetical protein [Bacteroidales bacterium]